jgi:hypothetical protein
MAASSNRLKRFACLSTALVLCFRVSVLAGPTPSTAPTGIEPALDAFAQSPPLMGWNSWSSTSWNGMGEKLDEKYVMATADIVAARLKPFGYNLISIDAAWESTWDEHGRMQPDPVLFPHGIKSLANYVHARGLKLGIYLMPGLPAGAARQDNTTVAGTHIRLIDIVDTSAPGNNLSKPSDKLHTAYRIDYSRPGSKEYIQSYVDMLAEWGIDYIKMDFVSPGGGKKGDNRPDIQQWHEAIKKSGRPIWLELSAALDIKCIDSWKANSNGWRIGDDMDKRKRDGKLTVWSHVARMFPLAAKWAPLAGPGGWNDLDALELGNGDHDGLTPDERRTMMTLWCISCSPLLLGSDLTKLDEDDFALITNQELLAIDQAGHVGTPISQSTPQQVWQVKNLDGSFTVALFNLADAAAKVSVSWSDLNLTGPANVRDLWQHKNLGKLTTGYETTLNPHACQLLRIQQ